MSIPFSASFLVCIFSCRDSVISCLPFVLLTEVNVPNSLSESAISQVSFIRGTGNLGSYFLSTYPVTWVLKLHCQNCPSV